MEQSKVACSSCGEQFPSDQGSFDDNCNPICPDCLKKLAEQEDDKA